MSEPYLLVSDIHFNNWGQFAKIDPKNGVNTRLLDILRELKRACKELYEAGGTQVIFAGDIFHVRGSLAPSVVVPVQQHLEWLNWNYGSHFVAIDGNHDLESRDSDEIRSAVEVLNAGYFSAVHCPSEHYSFGSSVILVPWYADLNQLRSEILAFPVKREEADLIIHAPLNGVIKGIPDTGLSPAEVESWGFKRVFCGHYHNAKHWNEKVFSIGALTHQTWSDVGSTAGSWLVWPDRVQHIPSEAPKFVDYDFAWSDLEQQEECDGNYVRVSLSDASETELATFREHLEGLGAAGVLMRVTPKTTTVPRASVASSTKTLEQSVADWIKLEYGDDSEIISKALEFLAKAP